MSNLTSLAWWKAASIRALRTALVIAIPYAPTVLYDGAWGILFGSAGFGALTSFVTSLFGIAETDGNTVPPFWAIFERVVKTTSQALLTAFGTATMFSEVNWPEVPALVGSAALGSLLLAVLKTLPESAKPVMAAALPTTIVNVQGETTAAEVPVVAVVDAADVPIASTQEPESPPAPEEPSVPEVPAPEPPPVEEPPAAPHGVPLR